MSRSRKQLLPVLIGPVALRRRCWLYGQRQGLREGQQGKGGSGGEARSQGMLGDLDLQGPRPIESSIVIPSSNTSFKTS